MLFLASFTRNPKDRFFICNMRQTTVIQPSIAAAVQKWENGDTVAVTNRDIVSTLARLRLEYGKKGFLKNPTVKNDMYVIACIKNTDNVMKQLQEQSPELFL